MDLANFSTTEEVKKANPNKRRLPTLANEHWPLFAGGHLISVWGTWVNWKRWVILPPVPYCPFVLSSSLFVNVEYVVRSFEVLRRDVN